FFMTSFSPLEAILSSFNWSENSRAGHFPQRGQVSAARSDHWHELNVGIAVAGQTKGPFRENALTFGSSIQSGAHREYRRGCKGIGR
ncbi:hypothetical protein, partial [Burkholderia pseudomallei]